MAKRYYRCRTDANQSEIVNALRKFGASVFILSRVGKGCPDLIVGWKGHNIFMEVKNGKTRWRLTPHQKKFHAEWQGQVAIVESPEDAIAILNLLDNISINALK